MIDRDEAIAMAKDAGYAPAFGAVQDKYINDELYALVNAAYNRGVEDCLNCYSIDDSATDWANKMVALKERS